MHVLCPHCQNLIESSEAAAAEEILCPSCGSSFRLERGTTGGWNPSEGQRKLGRFELIDAVGGGAFGTVYQARDPELDRTVAIKVPRAGNLAGAGDLQRFLREARSVARLRHPSIVPVHEVGEADGVPYLVSEFVQGVTLADLLTSRRPGQREAAGLVAAVADALQYAHDSGVVHRDVKPSNIMLDADGGPHVMDFGLAKRDAGEVTMTIDGQVLGTPAYMSPEQARGEAHKVDGRSDVYSLGVILYELLTGELPFRGNARMLLHQVLHDEPRPPRSLNDRIPRDLETVTLKALEKDPNRRYPSAAELAADLRRFLQGESIRARPVGAWEQAWRWSKRRPAVAVSVAASAVAVLALVGVVVGTVYNKKLQASNAQLGTAVAEKDESNGRLEKAVTEKESLLYAHRIVVAGREWTAGNAGRTIQLLDDCPSSLRGWEWQYLDRCCHTDLVTFTGHSEGVQGVAFSPDGTRIASSDDAGTVHIWDAVTGKECPVHLPAQASTVFSVSFSPNGQYLASASGDLGDPTKPGELKVWDTTTGRRFRKFHGHTSVVFSVAFSPDGRRLASGSYDRTVRVWDVATERVVFTGRGHSQDVLGVAFSPDGKRLASASGTVDQTAIERRPGEVRIWDVATGQGRLLFPDEKPLRCVAFSPDGERLAAGGYDGSINVLNAATGKVLRTLRGHTHYIGRLSYRPDGRRLASASDDGTVKVWDPEAGVELLSFRGHTSAVKDVAFDPEGLRVASASADNTVKVWLSTMDQEALTLRADKGWFPAVALSPDGGRLAAANTENTVTIWDPTTGQKLQTLSGHQYPVWGVAFHPQGRWLASCAGDQNDLKKPGEVKIWDVRTGREGAALPDLASWVQSVTFSPDGRLLASGSGDGAVTIWDVTNWTKLSTLNADKEPLYSVAFSPDGKRLASGGVHKVVTIWDTSTGRQIATFRDSSQWILGLVFSPDGGRLAAACFDKAIRIWDLASRKLTLELRGHAYFPIGVAFSPDGKRLASASVDKTVKLWDAATGQELLTLRGHADPVWAVAFSRDGQHLASASADGTVRIWDARPRTRAVQAERQAVGLLAFLFTKPLSRADVLQYLDATKAIGPDLRKNALALAGRYREETKPESFDQESRAVVLRPYLNKAQYRLALVQAEDASRLSPRDGRFLGTLGMARYRLGRYREALQTLSRANDLNRGSRAGDVAFLAMTYQQLGRPKQAREALERLWRGVGGRWAGDPEAKEFLREAEGVLAGTAPAAP